MSKPWAMYDDPNRMPAGGLIAVSDENGNVRIIMRDDRGDGSHRYVVLDKEAARGFADEILRRAGGPTVSSLTKTLGIMVNAFNVPEVDPLVAFVSIERARGELAKVSQ